MGTLDSCINDVFEPGNIGASSGTSPPDTPDGSQESEPITDWDSYPATLCEENAATLGVAQQDPTAVADSGKITVSIWMKIITAVPPSEFGNDIPVVFAGLYDGEDLYYQGFQIDLLTNRDETSVRNTVMVRIAGNRYELNTGDVYQVTSGDPETGNPDFDSNEFAPTMSFDQVLDLGTDEGDAIQPGQWFHFFFSVDLTYEESKADASAVTLSGSRVSMAINGKVLNLDLALNRDPNRDDVYASNVFGPFTNDNGGNVVVPLARSHGTGTYDSVVPPWTVPLAGFPIGFPMNDQFSWDAAVDVAVCGGLMWTNQYIDPRSAITNFVRGTYSAPTMVPVEVAIATYGQPQFVLDGGFAEFVANARGAAGAMTQVNTMSNYTPRPTLAT